MGIDYTIIGKRFGRLVVKEFGYIKNKASYWLCKCDCGNEKFVSRSGLTSGDIFSCGCYRNEHKSEFGFKHGYSNTKLYSIWSSMIQRTTNPKHDRYCAYGGRGITVFDEWKTAINFIEWALNNGYEEGLSIERIDVNGNYEPNNCKFIERNAQYENKQNSDLITYQGKTQSLSKWSRELGINRETLRYRINVAKWDLDKAFVVP